MNRIVLMVLRNILKVPGLYAKLCRYAKEPDRYPEQERWDHISHILQLAVKSGNVDLQVYCSQISSLISSLIIYLCAFVVFFKYFIQAQLRKRSEKLAAAAQEGGEEK